MTLAAGTRLGPYEIQSAIGAGGMGEVYKARDTRLERVVAIKVLPERLSSSPVSRARFEKEARAVAALSHPNICTIHDVGSAGELHYLVMEYLDGETLEAILARGALPLAETVRHGREIAAALSAAHRHGIVHGDLKPGNVMITPGGARLLDFGLARRVAIAGISSAEASEASTVEGALTNDGTILGTLQYMSPEQLHGGPMDHRSDIFALGALLFEMATGRKAFAAKSQAGVIAAILQGDPFAGDQPTVTPAALDRVVRTCLARNPDDRRESAADVAGELAWIAESRRENGEPAQPLRPEAPDRSILVLPFDNLSPDPGDAYFSDGLTEEIITNLSYLRGLRVISRSTAMVLKGTGKDVRTIGRELEVRYVLEGSVRKAGDALRITAQLIDARSDTHLWVDRFDGTLADVFDVQERIAHSIVDRLEVKLTAGERARMAARPIADPRAYQAYLRARQQTWEWTPAALDRARQQMDNGLELVGPNPLFYAGLAYVYFQYVNLGVENEEYISRAEHFARLALEMDPGSCEAHLVLGLLYQAFWGDQRESFRHFRSALERNPDDTHTLLWLIAGHTLVGKSAEALPLAHRAIRVDPLTPATRYMPVFLETWGARRRHSADELSLWFRLEPDSPVALFFCAMMLTYEDYRKEAEALLRENIRPGSGDVFTDLLRILHRTLERGGAAIDDLVTRQLERTAGRDPQLSYFLAGLQAAAGNRSSALTWLENAVTRGFVNHPFMAVHDPLLAGIRNEPEFQRIVGVAKKEWLRFDA